MNFSLAIPQLQRDGSVVYGSFDPLFPQPNEIVHTPPQVLGISGTGTPELGTWGTLQYTYRTLRSDRWYYLVSLYRQTRGASSPLWGHVLLQWPDPSQNNALVSATAVWEPMKQQTRGVGIASDIQVLFTHLGYQTNSITHQGAYYIPPYFF